MDMQKSLDMDQELKNQYPLTYNE